MKKFLSLVCAFVCSIFVFAGCTHTAGTDVTGITFTSDHYYLDLGVPTKLDYKIVPSTSEHLSPTFIALGDAFQVAANIQLTPDGYLTITNANRNFDKAEIVMRYGEMEDSCIVELKKYPTSIYSLETMYINSNGIMQIPYYGVFGSEEKIMDTSYYRARVTSSDETVISVENHNNVVVKSTGKQGKATVTIDVIASNGAYVTSDGSVLSTYSEESSILRTSVEVVVNNNVDNCTMLCSYVNSKNQTISEIYRDMKSTETVLEFDENITEYVIDPILLDSEGYIVDNIGFTIISLNENIVDIETLTDIEGNVTYKLVKKSEGDAQIIITSNGYGANGDLVMFKIKCEDKNLN